MGLLITPPGTVTGVTGTAPVVSSGGAAPAISMAAATDSVNGYLTSTDHTTLTSLSGFATGVAPTTPVGVPFFANKTGVDLKTNAVTDIFTVPSNRVFLAIWAGVVPTSVTGGAAVAFNWKIIESGASGSMTANTAAGSAAPVTTKNWIEQNTVPGNSPLLLCGSTNKVQISITAAFTTSTSVTGTVWVYGFYIS